MSYVHSYYHLVGITDEAKMREEAEYRYRTEDRVSVLHQHRNDEPCNDKCSDIDAHGHTAECEPNCEAVSEWRTLKEGRKVKVAD